MFFGILKGIVSCFFTTFWTNFLKIGKDLGNRTENGKFMFIYQAHQAFTIWHKVMPKIDDVTIKLLD